MDRIINVLRIQGPPERVMEVWERIKDPHAGLPLLRMYRASGLRWGKTIW